MFGSIQKFSESNFSVLMGVSLVAGTLFPVFGRVPDFVPPAILAVMMGFSYAKVSIEELKHIRPVEISIFYLVRFIAYPVFLYALCLVLCPQFKYAVLLLGLLPAAVSAAAMSSILGGNATLALAGTVVSSVAAPFVIPWVFGFFGADMQLDIAGMFLTLASIIFIPAIVYFGGIRFFKSPREWVQRNAGFFSVVLFSAFIVIVVARLRDEILTHLPSVGISALVLVVFYSSFYILAWIWMYKKDEKTRIAYTIFSGCNNMGLGVSLALLYFPGPEKLYVIICEFLWVLLLSGFQYFLKARKPQHG